MFLTTTTIAPASIITDELIFHGSQKPGVRGCYLASSLTGAQLADREDRWDGRQVGPGKEGRKGNRGRGGTGSSYGMVGSKGKGGWEEGHGLGAGSYKVI